jgi:starvation-inducible DNA-binding protein
MSMHSNFKHQQKVRDAFPLAQQEIPEMALSTGLTPQQVAKTAKTLEVTLSDTFLLYMRTLNFHWNVVGPYFPQLHRIFEEQYGVLAKNLDRLAERLRALGLAAPATLAQYLKLSNLSESTDRLNDAEMVQSLQEGHEQMASYIRQELAQIDPADGATQNMLEDILDQHEKFAWMLRSILEK